MLPILVALTLAGTLAVAGCSSSGVDRAQSGVGNVASSLAEPGQRPGQAVTAVLARERHSAIVEARLGPPPADFVPTDGVAEPPEDFAKGRWLYVTVAVPSETIEVARPVWEADLFAGAVRDRMRLNGDVLYGDEISLELPDGSVRRNRFGGFGAVKARQQFDGSSSASVAQQIREKATSEGLDVTSVDVLDFEQPAPAVTVTADDPNAFLARVQSGLVAKLFGGPPLYEGYYLQANDRSGQPFFIEASAFRSGAGHRWIRPDLTDGCGVDQSSPAPED